MALQTITTRSQDLQHISIHALPRIPLINTGANVEETVGEGIYGQWLDLDRLLVQFWESRSIRPRVGCTTLDRWDNYTRYCIGRLLPEATERGIVDLI